MSNELMIVLAAASVSALAGGALVGWLTTRRQGPDPELDGRYELQLGARTFEKVWFPPEVRTDWSPEQQLEAHGLELLRKDLEQNKKRRRAAAKATGAR